MKLAAVSCACLFLLAACGNDSTSHLSQVVECVRNGPQTLREFDTNETHATTGTGCSKAVPILSDARSDRDGTPLITANADGKTMISAHVFVPAFTSGQTFPVVLHSHGWGGGKLTKITPVTPGSKDMFQINSELTSSLVNDGYIVVSFSQRGWANSEGEIAVMSPERETQDAKAVVNWVAAEGKAGRLPVKFDDAAKTDPRIGTIGVSYGGAFQFLLAAEDPRIDTIVPFGTWHDLIYSLTPHRYTSNLDFAPGVFKHAFTNGLCLLGVKNPALSQSSGNRDDVLIQACTAAPSVVNNRMREEWDATNTVLPFGKTHTMRYYQYSGLSPVSAADNKNGFAPRAGFDRRGAVPTLLIQGSRDVLFNFNEAMWNYNYLKSLSPSVEVKLLTNLSGHMSNQWTGQVAEGSNCGKFQVVPTVKAWLKKYLKGDATDLSALALPNICMTLEADAAVPNQQNGVSLNTIVIGGGTAVPMTQEVTIATLTSNAYVFKKALTIVGNNQVLAGVPRLTKVTVCAPTPAPCMVASTTAAEQIAFVGIGIKRGSKMILVDDQVFPIRNKDADGSASKEFLLPGVAETLKAGDEVGLIYFAKHPQYNISCANPAGTDSLGPFPACLTPTPIDYYSMTADVEFPILTPNGVTVTTHRGQEP